MIGYLERVGEQLVEASRELSAAQTRPRPRRRFRRGALAIAIALVGSGTALAASSQLGSSDRASDAMKRLPEIAQQHKDRLETRSYGLNPDTAEHLFTTPDGLDVSKVSDPGETCVQVSDGEDHCYPASNVALGIAYTVTDNCTPGTGHPMRIMGAAPEGTSTVVIRYSRGDDHSIQAVSGVFLWDGTTPSQGQPHPTNIEYHGADGAILGSDKIRGGSDLCMTRESGG
jgi:hypothetical protein